MNFALHVFDVDNVAKIISELSIAVLEKVSIKLSLKKVSPGNVLPLLEHEGTLFSSFAFRP